MSKQKTTTQRNHRWSAEDDKRLGETVEALRPLKDRMQAQTEQKYSQRAYFNAVAGVLAVQHGIIVTGKACNQRLRNQEKVRQRDEARLRTKEAEAKAKEAEAKVKGASLPAPEGEAPLITLKNGMQVIEAPLSSGFFEHFSGYLNTLGEQVKKMDGALEDRTATSQIVDVELSHLLNNLKRWSGALEGTIGRLEKAVSRLDKLDLLFNSLEFRIAGGKNDNRNSDSKVL